MIPALSAYLKGKIDNCIEIINSKDINDSLMKACLKWLNIGIKSTSPYMEVIHESIKSQKLSKFIINSPNISTIVGISFSTLELLIKHKLLFSEDYKVLVKLALEEKYLNLEKLDCLDGNLEIVDMIYDYFKNAPNIKENHLAFLLKYMKYELIEANKARSDHMMISYRIEDYPSIISNSEAFKFTLLCYAIIFELISKDNPLFNCTIQRFIKILLNNGERQKTYFYADAFKHLEKLDNLHNYYAFLKEMINAENTTYISFSGYDVSKVPNYFINILYHVKKQALSDSYLATFELNLDEWLMMLKLIANKANISLTLANIEYLIDYTLNSISGCECSSIYNFLTSFLQSYTSEIKDIEYLGLLSNKLVSIDYESTPKDEPFQYFVEIFKKVTKIYERTTMKYENVIGLNELWYYFINGRKSISTLAENTLSIYYRTISPDALRSTIQRQVECLIEKGIQNYKGKRSTRILKQIKEQLSYYNNNYFNLSKEELKVVVIVERFGTYSFIIKPNTVVYSFMQKICNSII